MDRKRGRKGKEYVTETTCGPAKSKIFTIYSFTGKPCQPLSSHRMRCGQRHAYREEERTRNRHRKRELQSSAQLDIKDCSGDNGNVSSDPYFRVHNP